MAVTHEIERNIKGEHLLIKLEAEPTYWDKEQLDIDVVAAYNDDGEPVKIENNIDDLLTDNDYLFLWEKIEEDLS